jgi:hypothetical protein
MTRKGFDPPSGVDALIPPGDSTADPVLAGQTPTQL